MTSVFDLYKVKNGDINFFPRGMNHMNIDSSLWKVYAKNEQRLIKLRHDRPRIMEMLTSINFRVIMQAHDNFLYCTAAAVKKLEGNIHLSFNPEKITSFLRKSDLRLTFLKEIIYDVKYDELLKQLEKYLEGPTAEHSDESCIFAARVANSERGDVIYRFLLVYQKNYADTAFDKVVKFLELLTDTPSETVYVKYYMADNASIPFADQISTMTCRMRKRKKLRQKLNLTDDALLPACFLSDESSSPTPPLEDSIPPRFYSPSSESSSNNRDTETSPEISNSTDFLSIQPNVAP